MDKFEWIPTECAPELFPMEIINGSFLLEEDESIYIPDGRLIHNGWGETGSIHIVGDDQKPVPNYLQIHWFSYFEDKFYGGGFDIPQKEITKLFSEGFISPVDGEHVTYDYILTGLAPGGLIVIWLMGEQITTEVCAMYANELDIHWKNFCNNSKYTRKEYIQANLEEIMSKDEIFNIYKEGIPFGLWEKYRTRYSWEPIIIGNVTHVDISMAFYNGEQYYQDYRLNEEFQPHKKAVPKEINYTWESAGIEYCAEMLMDEKEIFFAFAKLYHEIEKTELKLQIEINTADLTVKTYLRNKEFIIELQKCEVSVF